MSWIAPAARSMVVARCATSASPSSSYFDVLGVSESANLEEIKAAFRTRSKLLHPDVNKAKNASAGNPIIMFLQPRLNFTAAPVLLDPPVSYAGTYSFVSTFNSDNIAAITPGWTISDLLDKLQKGLLYVNTHTTAQPGGALQGQLSCQYDMCMWPVCSAGPGVRC
ncbi:hypothetical protein PLESTB_001538900 [Pleodorina starrii]|uniref:J domain-containing protein n=1 Tax=Pleodorina starrii TaxID=330485 RepID=A0A9W6F836_9CHLO|nr:hypothetical protein PLESTM_001844100 [Pleodorina starrii]GLC59818.1 hypothetical protein PLESTB_001538900 [Pleodorina starrii]GLC67299.1 hypothetical protein PLESTF_000539900 [Pleodorina starrii]